MSDSGTEHRRETRHDFLTPIEFILDPPTVGDVLHKGVIVNITATGLGVYILDQLSTGQKIIIKTGLPVAPQPASIRWIKKEKTRFCRAGLKLL